MRIGLVSQGLKYISTFCPQPVPRAFFHFFPFNSWASREQKQIWKDFQVAISLPTSYSFHFVPFFFTLSLIQNLYWAYIEAFSISQSHLYCKETKAKEWKKKAKTKSFVKCQTKYWKILAIYSVHFISFSSLSLALFISTWKHIFSKDFNVEYFAHDLFGFPSHYFRLNLMSFISIYSYVFISMLKMMRIALVESQFFFFFSFHFVVFSLTTWISFILFIFFFSRLFWQIHFVILDLKNYMKRMMTKMIEWTFHHVANDRTMERKRRMYFRFIHSSKYD